MIKLPAYFTFVVSMLCITTVLRAAPPNTKEIVFQKLPTHWHANRLAAKDFHLRGGRSVALGEPYHLAELIIAGEGAVPFLLDLLYDNTKTKITYFGSLSFSGLKAVEDAKERTATVGDFADYALRRIYKKDVKYRSYLGDIERGTAILRWHDVARKEKAISGDAMKNYDIEDTLRKMLGEETGTGPVIARLRITKPIPPAVAMKTLPQKLPIMLMVMSLP